MRIVLTGGLGFVGRNLAEYIRRNSLPAQLVAIDWRAQGNEDHCLFDHVHAGCFASEAALDLCRKADVVVHLAATTTVQESIKTPLQSFENNAVKTLHLLDALRTGSPDAHLIFASTGGAIVGDHTGPVEETTPARPCAPYGASKLAAEALLSAYSGAFGLRTTSLRFSNVYGPMSEHKTSLVSVFCKAILTSRSLQIHGDGLQTRDFVHVEDICTAIWAVIRTGAGGVYQLGTGVETSVRDVARILSDCVAGPRPQIVHGPALRGEVRHNVCNIDRARRDLGFVPRVPLARGLPDTLEWFRAQLDQEDPNDAAHSTPHHDLVRPEILAGTGSAAPVGLIS